MIKNLDIKVEMKPTEPISFETLNPRDLIERTNFKISFTGEMDGKGLTALSRFLKTQGIDVDKLDAKKVPGGTH